MGTADGGFRSGSTRASRGEPMARAGTAVPAHSPEGGVSDIAAHPRIKPAIPHWIKPLVPSPAGGSRLPTRIDPLTEARIKPLIPPPVPAPDVQARPGSQQSMARPRAGARDGADASAAAVPRSGARGKEGGSA